MYFGFDPRQNVPAQATYTSLMMPHVAVETTRVDPVIRNIFGRFRDLNLLMLRDNLVRGQVARGDWSWGGELCPVAHGLGGCGVVQQARYVSQAQDLTAACRFTASRLGVLPFELQRFVDEWDLGIRSPGWLLAQIELLWQERLEDALAVQQVLEPAPNSRPKITEP